MLDGGCWMLGALGLARLRGPHRQLSTLNPQRSRHEATWFFVLIYEPAVALFEQASLIMRYLRTRTRETFDPGYTNWKAEGQRE